jgi:nucleoside-diphosphate-sugar epimerase
MSSTPHRVFLAGATGAIGQRLTPLLLDAGHHVAGTTRSAAKAEALRALGVEAVVVDVFDAEALLRSVAAVRPDVVIHQLTDLPKGLDPSLLAEAVGRNARIRDEGSRNLVRAAIAAGATRLVAQSIAWMYAPGPEPHAEGDALDLGADGSRGITARGVAALESQTLNAPPLAGIVLRYGQIHGPGADEPRDYAPLHVDAAAYAALLAIDRGSPGAFNVAGPNAHVTIDKARAELGWNADFRLPDRLLGAPTRSGRHHAL